MENKAKEKVSNGTDKTQIRCAKKLWQFNVVSVYIDLLYKPSHYTENEFDSNLKSQQTLLQVYQEYHVCLIRYSIAYKRHCDDIEYDDFVTPNFVQFKILFHFHLY